MVSFLFWNTAKEPIVSSHLVCLGRNHSIDVFLIAESPRDLGPAITELNTLRRGIYEEAGRARPKVRTVTRLRPPAIDHIATTLGGETAVWSMVAPKLHPPEMLVAATHLPSKFGGQIDANQIFYAGRVADELAELEDKRNHRNMVCVGDFNMNPYDPGMTHVGCFHGLMTKELALQGDRMYRNCAYRRFYNPMWGLFGDRTAGPAGTHFWDSAVPHNPHWAMFDQVLVRPSLIASLSRIEVLIHDGTHSLLASNGYPTKDHLSDHLPILFELDI